MSKKDGSVLVNPIHGEMLRFHVESWSDRKNPHLVDLLANDGAGECSCINWQTRKWPLVRDRKVPWNDPRNECRHIKAAKRCMVNMFIRHARDDLNLCNVK